MPDESHNRIAIWWIRRDIRLRDNATLETALSHARQVIPLFILDELLLAQPTPRRQAFLFNALHDLAAQLRARGSRLIIRRGRPIDELLRITRESGASLVSAEADVSPYARQRDDEIVAKLPLVLSQGVSAHPPEVVHKPNGGVYKVFTPFSRAWKALPAPGKPSLPPGRLPRVPQLSSDAIPPANPLEGFEASGEEAQRRLDEFIAGAIFSYKNDRNRLDIPGTSRLSPYLRFGMLSARQAVSAAQQALAAAKHRLEHDNAETWLNEIIWREFYGSILHHFPNVLRQSFRESLRGLRWRESADDLAAWQDGLSGFPAVDAGMRQLNATGWMHNRARMICASFLCKDLLINWQAGEAWFMRQLLDGDPASNNGGWQWTAGTGTDAAPYFRVFNPVLQGKKFDPAGQYVRTWVPELKAVPDEYIHAPWGMPADIQSLTGVHIGKDYPAPIVDHAFARERALAAYKKASQRTS